MDLAQYVHWRSPKQADKKRVYDTKGLTQTTDFLDPIDADQPKVSQSERNNTAMLQLPKLLFDSAFITLNGVTAGMLDYTL